MSHQLAGKVAIVTGASSGIGAATAHVLARHGVHVVLAARRRDHLDEHARDIIAAGGSCIAVQTDVTDSAQVTRLAARAGETFGPLDILVNNAGVNWTKPLVETPPEEIARLVTVNLLGAMLMTRAVLPDMLARHAGTIISVGSVQSRVPIEPLYAASKFGVRGFSLALRRQTAGSGVTASLVTPGNIRTGMTAALDERMPGPEIVADAIARLAVAPRREMIVPLKYHAIVWLDTVLPMLADAAFQWRHRGDTAAGGTGTLPAYARPAPARASE